MVGPRKGTRERAFAERLETALGDHPRAPDGYGRLTWLKRELEHSRVSVSVETIRKWCSGESMPRRAKMTALAKTLRVDETWLAMGAQPLATPIGPERTDALKEAMREISELTNDPAVLAIVKRHLGEE